MHVDLHLLPCTKFKFKRIKNSNINTDKLKLIEEDMGNCLENISIGNKFLNRKPVVQTLRLINNKSDLTKLITYFYVGVAT